MEEQQIISPLQSAPAVSSPDVSLSKAMDLFKRALVIYKKQLGFFLSVAVVPIIAVAIAWVAVAGAVFLQDKISSSVAGFLLLVLAGSLVLVAVVAQAWGQTALLYAVKDHQENIGVKEAYRRGWRKILSFWWINVLSGFIIMGGFLLFVAPGIILAVWFSLISFVLVVENITGMNALLKSREYIRGNWGAVLGRYLFIGLIALVFFFAPMSIFMILAAFVKIPFREEITQIITMAVNLFWAPLMTVYSFLIYERLKTAKNQLVFTPTKGKKVGFILLAIFGFLIVPMTIFIIAFSMVGPAREKGINAMRELDLQRARVSVEKYYIDNGKYPASLDDALGANGFPSFSDSKIKQLWRYEVQPDGQGYKVCVQLEKSEEKCLTNYATGSF